MAITGAVRGWRRLAAVAATGGLVCWSLLAVSSGSVAGATTTPLAIKIVGNHFVNGAGHTVRLLGVDRTSSEYGCVDGFGYDDGHFDAADATAIGSWGANAVRIPLNEDCWLGLNGQPNNSEGGTTLTQAGYQHEIEQYVADLNARGIYAILDLHWSAPGSQTALEQQPMPDQDHSPAFWSSVATVFKKNPAVVFDLFNEPFDPTDGRSGDDINPSDAVTWNCWQTGTTGGDLPDPCRTQAYDDSGVATARYQIAGFQTLLNAVRLAGATQPVLVGGLDYADDLGEADGGQSFLSHLPTDAQHQVAASFHNYMGKSCDNSTCWKDTVARVAAKIPVVTGEFAEDNFDEANCHDKTPSSFDEQYMDWADSAGVSYLAWAWIVESKAELDADGCDAFVLIDDYGLYKPASPNGAAVHNHLYAAAHPAKLTTFSVAVTPGAKTVVVKLRANEASTGTLTAKTVHHYVVGTGKAHIVTLGTTDLSLPANAITPITLKLSSADRALLKKKHSLSTRFTITLVDTASRTTVVHHTVTVTYPKH